MYYSKEALERMRKEGEAKAKEMDEKMKAEKIGQRYRSNDMSIHCVHCNHDRFNLSSALLNTRGLTFFDLDWLNESAHILICKKCGFIMWFGTEVNERK